MKAIRAWTLVLGSLAAMAWTGHANAQMKPKIQFSVQYPVFKVAYAPDGATFAVLASGAFSEKPSTDVRLYSSDDGKLAATLEGHKSRPTAMAFAPDGSVLVTGADDGECIIWDLKTAKAIASFQGDSKEVCKVALTPDGKKAAILGYDHVLELWDLDKRKKIASIGPHEERVVSIAFHPNGEILVGADEKGSMRRWDVGGLKEIPTLGRHGDVVTDLIFFRDGHELISCSKDLSVNSWISFNNGGWMAVRHLAQGSRDVPLSLSLSPDQRVLAVASTFELAFYDATLLRDEIPYPTQLRLTKYVYGGGDWAITQVAYHPKKNELLTGTPGGMIRVWKDTPTFEK
jgi:WD40 repeat protein